MKKLIIFLFLALLAFNMSAQSLFSGFVIPLSNHPSYFNSDKSLKAITAPVVLFRPALDMTGAVSFYNKVTKKFDPSGFVRPAMGLSLSFSKLVDGIPYEYLAVNLLGTIPIAEKMNYAVTVSALKLFDFNLKPSIGLIVDPNKFNTDYVPIGVLTGLKYTF